MTDSDDIAALCTRLRAFHSKIMNEAADTLTALQGELVHAREAEKTWREACEIMQDCREGK